MKMNIKSFTAKALLCLCIFSLMTSSAFALSHSDKTNLSKSQQNAVSAAQKAWASANARGDKAGMEAAHKAAESVRNSAGYSGGSDGSGYTKTSGGSKMTDKRNSSATNVSDYNKEAEKTVANGSYGKDNHTKADEKAMAKQVSDKDMESLAWLSDTYKQAQAEGDTATTKLCHELAETIRKDYGYSGGSDGGFYIPNTSTSSGTSPSKGSSGGGSGGSYTPPASVAEKFCTITASSGNGGAISPNGTMNLAKGSNKTFNITPNQGYKIEKVTIDGSSVGAVSSYTFSNITSAHTISATFIPSGRVNITGATIVDKDGKSTMKSGYGLYANIQSDYADVENVKVTASYNFGKGAKTTTLQKTTDNKFEFPVNSSSPTSQRCVYIPVETKDNSYTVTFTITGTNAAGQAVTATKTATITIKGNMHEDDFTSDRH